jgi:hypothetical protein
MNWLCAIKSTRSHESTFAELVAVASLAILRTVWNWRLSVDLVVVELHHELSILLGASHGHSNAYSEAIVDSSHI